MKNMTAKKKVIIILSIIGAILATITLIIGIVFIVAAKSTINTQMASFNVNEKAILWIAGLGEPFFGNSSGLAMIGIVLSLVALLAIITLWTIAGIRKRMKKQGSAGSMTAVAISSVAIVAAGAGLGLASYGSAEFKKSANLDNSIAYFEEHAVEISKNKDDAAKAALLYTLANKEGISSFASASTMQLSLAAILFGDMYAMKMEADPTLKSKYGNLFKTPEIIKDFEALDKKIKFIDHKTKKEIKAKEWFVSSGDAIEIGHSEQHAANILENIDAWSEILNGDYPAIHKMIKDLMPSNGAISPVVWVQLPEETKKVLTELKYTDKDGKVLSDKLFHFMQKLTSSALEFERRVVGTLGKLLDLPYGTKSEKVKTRLTVLEWLNTIVNSIDYISKDGSYQAFKGIKSTTLDGTIFKDAKLSQDPEHVYAGTYSENGTISIDFKSKPVGAKGDSVYDIKLALIQDVLEKLKTQKLHDKILKRQKSITTISFIMHILDSKGLKELTDQYAVFNSDYDENDIYGDVGEAKHITAVAKKISKFIK